MYLIIYDFDDTPEMRARDIRELYDWFYENGKHDLINWKELEETGITESECLTWKILRDPGYGYDAPLLTLFEIFDGSDPIQVYESDPTEEEDPNQMKLF